MCGTSAALLARMNRQSSRARAYAFDEEVTTLFRPTMRPEPRRRSSSGAKVQLNARVAPPPPAAIDPAAINAAAINFAAVKAAAAAAATPAKVAIATPYDASAPAVPARELPTVLDEPPAPPARPHTRKSKSTHEPILREPE